MTLKGFKIELLASKIKKKTLGKRKKDEVQNLKNTQYKNNPIVENGVLSPFSLPSSIPLCLSLSLPISLPLSLPISFPTSLPPSFFFSLPCSPSISS